MIRKPEMVSEDRVTIKYVGRLFYKGLYLLGWGLKTNGESLVRAVDPAKKVKV